eukprot:1286501-Amphidinium_carterae.1
MEIKYLWLQQAVYDKRLTMEKIPRERNKSDLLTKGCEKQDLAAHLKGLRMKRTSSPTSAKGMQVEVNLTEMSQSSSFRLLALMAALGPSGADATGLTTTTTTTTTLTQHNNYLDNSFNTVWAIIVTAVALFLTHAVWSTYEPKTHEPKLKGVQNASTQTDSITNVHPERIYVSPHGVCYHVDEDCDGLMHAMAVNGKRLCRLCIRVPRRGD